MKTEPSRCPWPTDALYQRYHDTEWGVPVHDDRRLFEYLILEGAQAGLSWHTVLKKRENYRTAFDQFDAEKIARYDDQKIAELLGNAGIIRNRLKIHATIQNAKACLQVRAEFGSFDAYLWRFVIRPTRHQPSPQHGRGSGPDEDFRRPEQGFAEARLQVCRLNDLLRQHAGCRHGE